jgi:hypothetical protein
MFSSHSIEKHIEHTAPTWALRPYLLMATLLAAVLLDEI